MNGLPLVIGEAKTPTRSAVTWFDGAYQVNEIYEKEIPAMFVPNVFSFATEGKLLRYGSIRMPIDLWGPWRDDDNQDEGELRHVRATVESLMRPERGAGHPAQLHALRHGQEAPAHQGHLPLPAVRRRRTRSSSAWWPGYPKKGLIWHFQGTGKIAADGLRRAEAAAASAAEQSHGADRGGPHRPRHPDHRHLQRRRHAEPGGRERPPGAADGCSRRTCARSSSRRSTSSARRTAC